MTIEIVCEVSIGKLRKLVNNFEKEGFVPISMTSEHKAQVNFSCILMHKKE